MFHEEDQERLYYFNLKRFKPHIRYRMETRSLFAGDAAVNEELLNNLTTYAHLALEWVGFGTLAGLLAKAIMPGKDPGGAIATLAMGVGGTVIGCGVASYFFRDHLITPISGIGFIVATAGAFIILFFYKLLGGYYFDETNGPVRYRARRTVATTRRRGQTVVVDDDGL